MMGALEDAGISTEGQRGYHLLWYHAQRGLICLGPPQAKQQTFVLLDAWVPPAPPLERAEALSRLARTYFRGHGPATIDDLARWAGLTLTEAREAHGWVADVLELMVVGEMEYWFDPEVAAPRPARDEAHLLPPFDEYFLGYRDRRPLLGRHYDAYHSAISKNGVLSATVVVGGRVVGTWRRTVRARRVDVEISSFEPLAQHRHSIEAAAARYAAHLGLAAEVTLSEAVT
jgi:hypothetical protein